MVQGYYSLEEAAKLLGMPTEDLKGMAQRREIRAFSDGGSWKFRNQDVDELSRTRSLGSDPEIRLAGAPASRKGDDIMDDSDEQVLLDESALSGIRLDSGADSEVTVIGMRGGPHDSGSDVRLVLNDESQQSDSDVRLVPDSGAKIDFGPVPRPDDHSDDEVPLGAAGAKAPSDSDIRLSFEDSAVGKKKSGGKAADMGRTEEIINLDDSSKILGKSAGGSSSGGSSARMKRPKPAPSDSDSDFKFDDVAAGFKLEGDSSSDFEITGFESSDEVVDIGKEKKKSDSGKLADSDSSKTKGLESIRLADDSDIGLGKPDDSDLTSGGPDSGINLAAPDDSGISLEESGSGSDSEFELSLDSESENDIFETDELPAFKDEDSSGGDAKTAAVAAGGKKDKAKPKRKEEETEVSSDSDFELALDDEYDSEQESGSEVVAIDEESSSVTDDTGVVATAVEDEDYDDFDDELVPTGGAVAAVPKARASAVAAAAQVPWQGWLLAPLTLTTILLIVVGMMMFEVMRNAWSYNTPYKITGPIIEWIAGFSKGG